VGDMGDMYRDWKAIKKEEAAKREAANMKSINQWLEDAGEDFETMSIQFMSGIIGFRFPGKPKIDFYPTKNKWRSGGATHYGDVVKFLEWYAKQ